MNEELENYISKTTKKNNRGAVSILTIIVALCLIWIVAFFYVLPTLRLEELQEQLWETKMKIKYYRCE